MTEHLAPYDTADVSSYFVRDEKIIRQSELAAQVQQLIALVREYDAAFAHLFEMYRVHFGDKNTPALPVLAQWAVSELQCQRAENRKLRGSLEMFRADHARQNDEIEQLRNEITARVSALTKANIEIQSLRESKQHESDLAQARANFKVAPNAEN